jgi:hypothetical protein
VALIDQDLAQQPAGAPLLRQRTLELGGCKKPVFDEQCPERAPGKSA